MGVIVVRLPLLSNGFPLSVCTSVAVMLAGAVCLVRYSDYSKKHHCVDSHSVTDAFTDTVDYSYFIGVQKRLIILSYFITPEGSPGLKI